MALPQRRRLSGGGSSWRLEEDVEGLTTCK